MACVGVVGVHAPARVRVDANRDRRALAMTRAKLDPDAKICSACYQKAWRGKKKAETNREL